jgi:hypothetical protein
MKQVFAVAPYNHGINFKMQVYNAWVKMGGKTMPAHYPWRAFHKFAYNYELPTFHKSDKIAQLRFVEPISLSFDTFPDYARYEIIPMIWDCWPMHFERVCHWLSKHNVKCAIFTSSQTSERMKKRFPELNILTITEGINTSLYSGGDILQNRKIDLMEYGRGNDRFFKIILPNSFKHLKSIKEQHLFKTNEEFYKALGETKITFSFPRNMTSPQEAGDVETLTQRYWECMLSRIIMIGKAPKELISLIGYNPVIDVDFINPNEQVVSILNNIQNYQLLVDKNREIALRYADWTQRIKVIIEWLKSIGYCI